MQKYDIPVLSPEDCERVFHQFRWTKGIRCLKCNTPQNKIYRDKRTALLKYYCKKCQLWFNDFSGTILEGTHLSLNQWLSAIYLFLKLGATASEVSHKLNINRNTAQTMFHKIQQEKLWCQLLLNRVCAELKQEPAILFSLEEAMNYLDLTRRSIYRLIKSGELPGLKVAGRWKFRPEDIQEYLYSKVMLCTTYAMQEYYFFRPEVLDKYRKDPERYYINGDAYRGWVGSIQDHRYVQKLLEVSGTKRFHGMARVQYYNIQYFKLVTPEGHLALAVRYKDYDELPAEEYVHWSGYIIKSLIRR